MATAKKAPAKVVKSAAKKTATKAVAKKAAVKTTAAKMPAKKTAQVKVAATHTEVAALAHKYYIERGGHHGSDADDWLRAEMELLG